MSKLDDRWLWFIDDGPLQALLKAEGEVGTMKMRAASSPALVRAMSSQLEGRSQQAIEELRAAIGDGERQPELYLMLGQLLFETSNYDEAILVYRKLIEADPANVPGLFNLGVCFEKLSRWNEAADAFRRSSKLDSSRKEAWLGLGLTCLHQRKAEEALGAFEKYLENDKDNESALFGRAVALQMLRRFDDASAIYDRFRHDGEPSPELLTNLLALAIARKDNTSLAKIAADLASARPDSRQALEAGAYSAMLSGNWEEACAPLSVLADLKALPEDWSYARAYALWQSGKTKEALDHLESLLQSPGFQGSALLLKGAILEARRQQPEALAAYRKAAYHMPESEAAHWNMARLGAAEGKSEVCKQASKALLERNRHSPEGWYATGLAAALEGKAEDGAAAFVEAVRLRGGWAEAEWNLGLCLLERGDIAKAESTLERAYKELEAKPDPEPLIHAALESKRLDAAFERFRAANPSALTAELVFNLGLALQEAGRPQDAETVYRSILEDAAVREDALINLGHVLLALGRPEDAEEVWKQVETPAAC
jgi:tetratricopeptide (TPR) repeat protein